MKSVLNSSRPLELQPPAAMPSVVTHRYDPDQGACLNLCSLPDAQADEILARLGRETRPTLKPGYLAKRRDTEHWLLQAASQVLCREQTQRPAYFFLGDFSHLPDLSRPAALVLPLAGFSDQAVTFTLGDSMSVAQEPFRRLYTLKELIRRFAEGVALSDFGYSDRCGFQARFVEMQLWEPLPAGSLKSQCRMLA